MVKTKIKETPMMKQYFAFKAEHPEAVLLFRCGDFYETYGDDAEIASKVLGIVLTKRSSAMQDAVPMAGFPHHSIDIYLPKLVRAGYKVAVADQLEDPKLTNKIVKRGVTELVTPGVVFNEQLLDRKEHNYIAGFVSDGKKSGVAFLDVSTGSFQVSEGSVDFIATLMSSFSPKEVLVQRGCTEGVKEKFGNDFYISTLDEWAFVYDNSVEKLKKQLSVDSLKGFGVDRYPLGVTAAGALIVYLEQTHHTGLANICSISRIDEGDFVWMDRFTFRNLEIFSSVFGGEGVALVDVIDKCSSPMGSRLLRSWLSMPVMDIDELNRRYDVTDYFIENQDKLQELASCMSELGDQERIVSRAAAGKISPREIMQLKRGLMQTPKIMNICSSEGAPESLTHLMSGIADCSSLLDLLTHTMHPDPAAAIGKGDVIGPGVDEELDHLRSVARNGKDILLQIQQREIEKTGIPSLKISYNNVFGYFIEVRNMYKDKVPEEWVRKQTLVNAERYVTEELKQYENEILGAEEKIYLIETRLYAELVSKIQQNIALIQKNCNIMARLDVLSGFADLSISNKYVRPVVDDSDVIDLKGARHPVIETLMPDGEEYVSNDIYLDSKKQQIIILTGPNMAGKSALLRQTALIVLLAQIGCHVPADSAHIGYCDKIFTRVGASDNISRGESTFMVEMLETSMILHNVSPRSLVLLDEIGRGTSTYDGMSIARAIVEYLHEKAGGAKTLFATHYHELNDMEEIYPRVKNFHIAVKEVGKKVLFLRKLREGGVAHSFGLHVARMAGMPVEVIESAERTLAALENKEENSISKPVRKHNIKEGEVQSDGSLQLSFFQLDDPLLMSLRDDLNSVDINNMTPLQAFDVLRSMKEKMGI